MVNNDLKILRLLHETTWDLNENTCAVAAKDRHLECLKYAHEN